MKNKLFRIFVTIGVGFIVSQSEAQQSSPTSEIRRVAPHPLFPHGPLTTLPIPSAKPLTLGIDRTTGRLIATDVWAGRIGHETMVKDSGHVFDEEGRMTDEIGLSHIIWCYILGNTFELETNGTTLNVSMILYYYDWTHNSNPHDYLHTFWVEASDDTGLVGKAYYGYTGGFPDHYKESIPISRLKIETLSHEKTKAGETLWIVKVNCSVELQRQVDFMPDIHIDCMSGGGQQWSYNASGSQHKTTVSDLKLQLQKSIVATTNLAKANILNSPASTSDSTNSTTSFPLPEITLSITKQDGFLLITFSPVVANANLEAANPSSYPWAWQPAATATNTATNGWYVAPTPEPRVFRVRIDR